ncbi:MAG: thiol peroxidase [Kurthia sp.]|uniref:Thiol peroxidase n=1 Tax=Kurthia zopfii TaxID=1650 RepID=A0A2U3AEY3_9BACL|nr:thiol peroxidase [Kurthia zopfii]PWI23099.1 thiol peroxidase [Kurthia zopfii]TDR40564.1 thiol peroxidase (atypical 2-Cys peroxiredoxin) [Kurthia zopfii]STX10303.1 Probable thiol peroxidase [Kurthia zopfii]VEI08402.1 Probable thiol peroxidase [Kurthia zopfii]GEK30123.1 putative thiol peroxidase [Kurthia zopfii]
MVQVTFINNPVTLVGDEMKVGSKAPNFTVVDNGLGEKTLQDFAGKKILVSVVPSLDTGVCDAQTRRFNEEAAAFGEDVVVLTISMDLPFAQKRWCGANGIDNVVTLSDHRDASFGDAFGVHMKELRLLARSIFVIDATGTVTYAEYVSEGTNHPDYDKALEALKAL